MSSDDFLEFDDGQSSEGSSANRPFLLAAGGLVVVLILAVICTFFVYTQNQGNRNEEVAAIETQNAETNIENTAVAQTVTAMAAEAQQVPTDTPAPPATNTPVPTLTATPAPTETPVVAQAEEAGEGEEDAEATSGEGGEVDGTEGDGTVAEGEEGAAGSDASADGSTDSSTDGSTAATGSGDDRDEPALGGSGEDALPQTGLETWSAALLALFFVGVLVAARRLRS